MIGETVLSSVPGWIVDLPPKFWLHLIDPAVRSFVIATLAGLVLYVTRARNLSLRLSVWKAVVCAALVMPILASCLPPLPIFVPVVDRFEGAFTNRRQMSAPVVSIAKRPEGQIANTATLDVVRTTEHPTAPHTPSAHRAYPGFRFRTISGSVLAVVAYLGVSLFLSLRFFLGWFLSQKLRLSSRTIVDQDAANIFRSQAHASQLRVCPRFAESQRLTVPLTCGVVHPAVLVPSNWRTWDSATLRAVITHEISHVARHDALTERLALVHRIVFWFSPLAWWLPGCLADLAEEASDAAALAAGTEPTKYAEILLRFLETLNSGAGRAQWQGVAMAQAGRAEKRFDRILSGRPIVAKQIKKSLVAVAVFAAVPAVLLAASLQPRLLSKQIVLNAYLSRPVATSPLVQQASSTTEPAPTALPSAAPLAPTNQPSMTPVTVLAPPRPPLAVAVPPVASAQIPTVPPTPAPVPVPHIVVVAPGRNSYVISDDDGSPYAIISGNSQTISGSFSSTDFRQLEALRKKIKGDFIWFEREGKSYVITDPSLVNRAKQAFERQTLLGQKEGELGEQLGKLGELQGQLGEQQGVIGEQMGKLYSNFAQLNIQMPDMKEEIRALQEQAQELAKSAAAQFDSDAFRASMEKMQKNLAEAQRAFAETSCQIELDSLRD